MRWHICETGKYAITHMRDMNIWGDTYERNQCMRWHMWETWMYEMTHMRDKTIWERHIWERHIADIKEACHTCGWGMSHIWMRRGTHMYESCHAYEYGMSDRKGYGVPTVSRIDKSIGLFCKLLSLLSGSFAKETYSLIDPTNRSHPIMSHTHGVCHAIWLRHVTSTQQSCHVYMNTVTYMNETCHAYVWVMAYTWIGGRE